MNKKYVLFDILRLNANGDLGLMPAEMSIENPRRDHRDQATFVGIAVLEQDYEKRVLRRIQVIPLFRRLKHDQLIAMFPRVEQILKGQFPEDYTIC